MHVHLQQRCILTDMIHILNEGTEPRFTSINMEVCMLSLMDVYVILVSL